MSSLTKFRAVLNERILDPVFCICFNFWMSIHEGLPFDKQGGSEHDPSLINVFHAILDLMQESCRNPLFPTVYAQFIQYLRLKSGYNCSEDRDMNHYLRASSRLFLVTPGHYMQHKGFIDNIVLLLSTFP